MDRGVLPWGWSGLCMKLTTDLHLVSALITSGVLSPLLFTPLWLEQGKLSFYPYDELLTRLLQTYTLCCNVPQS